MQKESKYTTMSIRDGILYITYKPIPEVDLRAAKKIVAGRLIFQRHQSYPILCRIQQLKNITDQALDHFATKGSLMASAIAILTNNDYDQSLALLFRDVHHPQVPVKLFKSELNALAFLQDYK